MQACRYEDPDGQFKLRSKLIPEPRAGEVLIVVEAAGLCHSDLHILKGHVEHLDPYSVKAPLTLGHEVTGNVTKLGPGVSAFKKGDRVAVAQVGYPIEEASWDTSVGLGADGGLAEYVIANTRCVVKVPENVPLHLAAVATDAVSTAYHAVVQEAKAGPGGLGLNGVTIAALKGATVYGFDIETKKFESAQVCGAFTCYKDMGGVEDVTFHAIADFAGVGAITVMAINHVKVGGVVVLVGLGVNEATLPTATLTMESAHFKGCMGASLKEYQEVLEYISLGIIVPAAEEITFRDVNAGLDRLEQGNVSGRLCTNPSARKGA
ncbi:hypothetical protein E4T47_08433 [Aureobasidium subglaciale]|nr:hypothetical protein E4T47_08433 [Aureobasidium subglaciale]